MYDFYDKRRRHITLRQEQHQSFILMWKKINSSQAQKPSKFYYMGPMFRYETPQAGRFASIPELVWSVLWI